MVERSSYIDTPNDTLAVPTESSSFLVKEYYLKKSISSPSTFHEVIVAPENAKDALHERSKSETAFVRDLKS